MLDERKLEFWLELFAKKWGGSRLLGRVGVIAGHSLDTVKIYLQQPMVKA